MQASQAVIEVASGAFAASLNHYGVGGTSMVTTMQIDDWVFVVGQDVFSVVRHRLDKWLALQDLDDEPQVIECDDAQQAWELLQLLREDALLWQCGACDAWIFTSNRPRVGVLQCSTCGDGGVNFRHADRQFGLDESPD